MQKNIHPKLRPVAFRDSAANSIFILLSTVETKGTVEYRNTTYPLYELEISSASHPFYTGKQKLVDTAGRIERFRNRYKIDSQKGNENAVSKSKNN